MRCHFSETQYSFAFTSEYIRRRRIARMPFFPTLVQEGRIYGYDVRINYSTFFQYKVPEFFNRRNQGTRKYWEEFGHDYYKIRLNTNSKQFRLLKSLRLGKPHNKVYYATPEFYSQRHFANHYMTRSIEHHSAIFPIDNLPNYQSGYHTLIYHESKNYGVCFSDPKRVQKEDLSDVFYDKGETTLFKTAREIQMIFKEEFKLNGNFKFNESRPFEYIREVAIALRTNFNTAWIAHRLIP